MPWSTSNQIMQSAAHLFFASARKKPQNIIEKIEGLSLIGRYEFRSYLETARGRRKKMAMSPSSTGHHAGHYDIKYSLFD